MRSERGWEASQRLTAQLPAETLAGEAAAAAAAMRMAALASAAERAVLEEEFKWLLREEVHSVLRQLQEILKEASHRFNLPVSSSEGPVKQENFILGTSNADQVKGILTLQGDALCQADINLKMPRNNQLVHFAFRDDKQWKLQQIQDARNHVNQAVYLLTNRSANYQFKTGCEVLKLMDAVMLQLTRARNRLTTPATLSLPEIAASGLTCSPPQNARKFCHPFSAAAVKGGLGHTKKRFGDQGCGPRLQFLRSGVSTRCGLKSQVFSCNGAIEALPGFFRWVALKLSGTSIIPSQLPS
ncbi:protein rogdi homolog isoform 2-T2 [Liasis olivaceus]